jgi:DNA mismatch repair protein MutS
LNKLADDLPLFKAFREPPQKPFGPSPLEEKLKGINPDELSPKEALETLYALKSL